VADTTGHLGKRRTEEQVYGVGDIPEQLRGSGTDLRDGWPVEPNVGRVADGVPARAHRIKALGNAVVPQIPEQIGRIIKQLEGAL
jgi:hypothetical protein